MRYDNEMIERYFKNEMNVEEEKHFVEELKSKPYLKFCTEAISALVCRIKKKGEEEDTTIINDVKCRAEDGQ